MLEKEIDILKHKIVPEHIVLKDEEKREILNKLNITPLHLPKVLTNDPVVKALGAKEGDVIKIIRSSPTAGKSIYYRVVIKD